MRNKKVLFMAEFSIMAAIEALFCFTPLGSLPIGVIVATTAHIPIIVCALYMGTASATLLGFLTGIFSLLIWTFAPPNPYMAFLYTPFVTYGPFAGNILSLAVCIVPRVLIGTLTGLMSSFLRKVKANRYLRYALSGVAGSAANTVFTLLMYYFFFAGQLADTLSTDIAGVVAVLMGIVTTNGIMEAALGGGVAALLGRPLEKAHSRLTARQ